MWCVWVTAEVAVWPVMTDTRQVSATDIDSITSRSTNTAAAEAKVNDDDDQRNFSETLTSDMIPTPPHPSHRSPITQPPTAGKSLWCWNVTLQAHVRAAEPAVVVGTFRVLPWDEWTCRKWSIKLHGWKTHRFSKWFGLPFSRPEIWSFSGLQIHLPRRLPLSYTLRVFNRDMF